MTGDIIFKIVEMALLVAGTCSELHVVRLVVGALCFLAFFAQAGFALRSVFFMLSTRALHTFKRELRLKPCQVLAITYRDLRSSDQALCFTQSNIT